MCCVRWAESILLCILIRLRRTENVQLINEIQQYKAFVDGYLLDLLRRDRVNVILSTFTTNMIGSLSTLKYLYYM